MDAASSLREGAGLWPHPDSGGNPGRTPRISIPTAAATPVAALINFIVPDIPVASDMLKG
jgi:hypothetical protein